MKSARQFFRLIHISFILARYGLDDVIFTLHLFRPLRFLRVLNPWYWTADRRLPRAERLRLCLEALGPIFVKFGQVLSTRKDILPADLSRELTKLQNCVPPFPGSKARAIIEAEFGKSIDQIFSEFEEIPLASASIAQVHCAVLHSGESVVVKVLRPGIEPIIKRDVALLYTLASFAQRYSAGLRRLRPCDVVAEFEAHLNDEMDFTIEAANASQLRRNFKDSKELYVPKVYWDYVSRRAMVMERVDGIPVNDIPALKAAGINLPMLAERGVHIFFTQVFEHDFFHADMHPGNILVSREHPEDPQYIAVDCGIMGALGDQDKRYLAENLLAILDQDYRRVAELHIASGWVSKGTRVEHFATSVRQVCEPVFDQPLKDISLGQTLMRLLQTAQKFHMELLPQLVLLQKTLLNIEGLGRELDPDLNPWVTAKPFLRRWLRKQLGPGAILKQLRQQAPLWSAYLPELPGLLYSSLRHFSDQEPMSPARPILREGDDSVISSTSSLWRAGFVGVVFGTATYVALSMIGG